MNKNVIDIYERDMSETCVCVCVYLTVIAGKSLECFDGIKIYSNRLV